MPSTGVENDTDLERVGLSLPSGDVEPRLESVVELVVADEIVEENESDGGRGNGGLDENKDDLGSRDSIAYEVVCCFGSGGSGGTGGMGKLISGPKCVCRKYVVK